MKETEKHPETPHFEMVKACKTIGIETPEDVRWVKWKMCYCGEELPTLKRFLFTWSSGVEQVLRLGQCQNCKTVYWEPA